MFSVINIDWLQLNCRAISGYYYINEPDYVIKPTDIRTRHFLKIDELFLNDRKIATIAREPSSQVLDKNIILIKFENWLLYCKDLKHIVINTLNKINFVCVNITRFDLALDFQYFQNNLYPEKLINKFISNKYLKKGKGKGTLIFNHNYNVSKEYIKFGSNQSDICYYLYNKTKELNEVKNKPYIQDCWHENNFDKNKNTWRLEFSLKNSNINIFNECTGELDQIRNGKEINLNYFLDEKFYIEFFWALVNKYFVFYKNTGTGKKCRMPEINLFNDFSVTKNMQYITNKIENGRSDKIFLNKINSLNDELRNIYRDNELLQKQKDLIKHFVASRNLQKYADKKGIEY